VTVKPDVFALPAVCVAYTVVRGRYFIHSGGMILPHALRASATRWLTLTGSRELLGRPDLPGLAKPLTIPCHSGIFGVYLSET
jgi:hypothetical protein